MRYIAESADGPTRVQRTLTWVVFLAAVSAVAYHCADGAANCISPPSPCLVPLLVLGDVAVNEGGALGLSLQRGFAAGGEPLTRTAAVALTPYRDDGPSLIEKPNWGRCS